jgi:predicted dehydrogenase
MSRKLRMAMIGGGSATSIGPIHRLGADLSGRVDLVAGVFSRSADRARAAGVEYGVGADRCYASTQAMFAAERARDDGIDFVTIVTPNNQHLPAALEAIEAGVHILCDKPATTTLAEALALREALAKGRSRFALTFTYTGFPMVREARARVAAGEIGRVRKVVVTYAQGWLATAAEKSGHVGAEWRMDPERGGVGGSSADIGVHAFTLAEFIAGAPVSEICADLNSLLEGRRLDDDCNALLRFANGAVGVLTTSQAAFGERNALSIQVYGDAGAVSWAVEQAEELKLVRGGSTQILTPASSGLLTVEPLPRGLGVSVVAAFSVLYRDFARALTDAPALIDDVLPGIEAGVRSMRFVERAVENSRARAGWTRLD